MLRSEIKLIEIPQYNIQTFCVENLTYAQINLNIGIILIKTRCLKPSRTQNSQVAPREGGL